MVIHNANDTPKWVKTTHDFVLNNILDTFVALCDILQDIQNNEYASDCNSAHQARSLKENIMCDTFLTTAIMYKRCFILSLLSVKCWRLRTSYYRAQVNINVIIRLDNSHNLNIITIQK